MKKATYIVITLLIAAVTVPAQRTYPISIVGVQVTDSNASNITGPYISGTVKYVDSIKTLILRGAIIGDSNQHFQAPLLRADSSITIRFEDTNTILGYRCTPIIELFDTTHFISPSNAVLNIRHCRCNTTSMETSIRAKDIFFNADGKITISRDHRNSYYVYNLPLIKARVTNREIRFSNGIVNLIGSSSPIANYDRVIFENKYITYPPNTYYDSTTHTFGNPICSLDSMVISSEYTQPYLRPIYPITIAGTQVTVLNADSIVGEGISGHVSYDSLSNTLILNNATISRMNYIGIQCDSSVTIKCIGKNIVDGRNNNAVANSQKPMVLNGANTIIYGNGTNDTLELLTYRNHEIMSMYRLEMSDMTLISLVGNGIYNVTGAGFTLNNCDAKIIGEMNNGPIANFSNLYLNGCRIVRPVGHSYSTANRRIEDSTGNLIRYMDTLVIEKSPVGILSAGKEKTELMPNPVSTNLYVVSESVIDQLQVFDTYGRLLKTLSPTTKQAIVNVRELPNGVYTIKIKTDGGIITKRFVVRH
jgi:hypothetical protein